MKIGRRHQCESHSPAADRENISSSSAIWSFFFNPSIRTFSAVVDAAAAASGRERADGRELVRALTIAKINIRLLG
jgi:hypothetical protein